MPACCYLVRCLLSRIPEEAQRGCEHSTHQPRREEDRNRGPCGGGLAEPGAGTEMGIPKGEMISPQGIHATQATWNGRSYLGALSLSETSTRGETAERWMGILSTVRV